MKHQYMNNNQFHIYVKYPGNDDLEDRSFVTDYNELIAVLSSKEVKCLYEMDALEELKQAININLKRKSKDTYMIHIKDISIDCITNGYRITTLVFYF